jgi:hypothetical protein
MHVPAAVVVGVWKGSKAKQMIFEEAPNENQIMFKTSRFKELLGMAVQSSP